MVTSGLVLEQGNTLIEPQKLGNGDLWLALRHITDYFKPYLP